MIPGRITRAFKPARRSPLRAALLYALFGGAWIIGSDRLLLLVTGDPSLLTQFALAKGLGFVAVTSALLYFLLSGYRSPAYAVAGAAPHSPQAPGKRRLSLLMAILLMVVPLLGLVISLKEAPRIEREAFMELSAIAELKSAQVTSWLDERHRDGMSLSNDRHFVRQVARAMMPGHETERETIRQRLSAFRDAYGYHAVTLLDERGKPLVQVGEIHTQSSGHPSAPGGSHNHHTDMMSGREMAGPHQAGHEMIHHSHGNAGLHLHFVFSLRNGPEHAALATLRVEIDPERFLFPYITRWSTASASGETLLAEAWEDTVVFLTPLRHRKGETGTLTHPLTDNRLLAAVALRHGGSGIFRGSDYRGAEVLAAYHPVAGTPWQLIAKLDRNEVLAPLFTLVSWVSLVTLLAIVVVGSLLLRMWQQQQWVTALTVESEKRKTDLLLQQFFDMPFIGIAITSPQSGNWLRFNDRLCEILGYPREELVKMSWPQLIHPDELDADVAEFDKVMRGESDGYSMDKRFIRQDGSVVDAYLDIKCIRKANGEADYLFAMVQDISERKRVEQALDRARREAQQYLDIAGVIMISLDRDGRIKLLNRRACEILGYAEEELLGREWFDCCLPETTRNEVRAVFAQLVAGEIEPVEYFENPVITRDGQQRLIAWHNAVVRDANGRITDILSSGEDITAQRATETNLIASESRLRTLVQTIPDLVWLKNTEGHYLACNPMFERFFGASEAEVLGRTDYDFVDTELADFFRQHDLKAMAAGKPSRNEESLTFAADGYSGTFETIKTPMFDSDGQLIGVLGIARDISERRRHMARIERLSSLYATLSQTNQAIVRSRSEEELFAQVCRNTVVYGGFRMAWVGLIDPHSHSVVPKSDFGGDSDYLQALRISVDPDSRYGKGPTGSALREGRPYWCQDFLQQSLTQPWHDMARQAGYAASAALPLRRSGEIIGSFNIYAGEINAFDESTRELLLEMATDINFALDSFEQERQRQQAEERLALVIKGSNDAPWDWDLELERFWYSPQWWQLLGYEIDELPADTMLWRRLAHPEDLPAVDQAIGSIMQPGHEWAEVECRFRHKDGHYIPTLIRSFASRDEEDRAVRLSGTTMDLTERKHIEAQLRNQRDELLQAKHRLDSHLEHSPVGVIEWDPAFRIIRWSNRAAEIFGWSEAEMLHKHPDDFRSVFTGDDAAVLDSIGKLVNGEEKQHHSIHCHATRNGSVRYVEWYSSALRNEQGELLSILSLTQDITEQRQAELARKHLSDALRQSASPIAMLDDKLNFTFTNEAFNELFGFEPNEVIGQSVALITPPDDSRTLPPAQVENIVKQRRIFRGEVLRRHKGGELIPTYLTGAPLTDDDGALNGFVGNYSDLRPIKASEKKLKEALTDTITAISHTIEKRDPYTAGHQQRVAELATAIAGEMQLEPARIEGIYLGSLIHDIGKIYIPSEILNRPGRLSKYEFGLIQSHPEVGYEIIKDVKFDWPISQMVYQHHERIDGSGYPRGLKGEEICLEARIIAIADIVEAMTSHRPYRPGLGLEPALAQIEKEAGTTLDGEIVAACLRLFREQNFSWADPYSA